MLIQACSFMKPNTKVVDLYMRDDFKTQNPKVIVLPITTLTAGTNEETKLMTASLLNKWYGLYGKDNIIPAAPVFEKLLENNKTKLAYLKIVNTFDNVSITEQLLAKNKEVRNLIESITSQLGVVGKVRLAFAITDANEKNYEQGRPLYLAIGLFDTGKLTWKTISKTQTTKSKVGKFKADYNSIIDTTFNLVREDLKNEQVKNK